MRKTMFLLALLAIQQTAFAEMPKTADGHFVDENGMTLYTFDKDTTPGQSACTGGCATAWPGAMADASASPGRSSSCLDACRLLVRSPNVRTSTS